MTIEQAVILLNTNHTGETRRLFVVSHLFLLIQTQ